MIEKVVGFKVGEQFFPSIEEAQKQELIDVLKVLPESKEAAAELILKHKDLVLDILTMTPSSKPRARKINGGRKVRKTSLEPAQASEVMKP